MKFTFRKVDDGYYDVLYGGLAIGTVYYDETAWSYAAWLIEGEAKRLDTNAGSGSKLKPRGYATRQAAAKYLLWNKQEVG